MIPPNRIHWKRAIGSFLYDSALKNIINDLAAERAAFSIRIIRASKGTRNVMLSHDSKQLETAFLLIGPIIYLAAFALRFRHVPTLPRRQSVLHRLSVGGNRYLSYVGDVNFEENWFRSPSNLLPSVNQTVKTEERISLLGKTARESGELTVLCE